MIGKARNFREYKVWQDAVAFATTIYKVTNELPRFEKKGLCDQLQRAVVSISSNIAEGAGRPSNADFAHFLDLSLGSANEVETQLLISKNLNYIDEEQHKIMMLELTSIQKQLTGLIFSIRKEEKEQHY
ncbi:MAG: four helix bundle protein [Prevotella sp.]|nr:four helix bundle protein [Prevotella sp.]